MSEQRPIGVIGVGWVGLVTASCFAELGHEVIAMDIDAGKISRLQAGEAPIHEPGIENLLERNRERLRFTTEVGEVLDSARLLFCCVDTPPTYSGDADLSRVHAVVAELAGDTSHALVMKSTVPAGTGAAIRREVPDLAYVSCPEFLKEGTAVDDFMKPDRVVIGTDEPEVESVMRSLYEPFVRTGNPILVMDHVSAELTKYAANAMLATRISFMNEIANFCDAVGADVRQIRLGLGADSRIGSSFLFPGVGYGGSCFPKDVKALLRMGEEAGLELAVVGAVDRTNEAQKRMLVPRIEQHLGGLRGKTVGIWGLAFKPRTDDMREAPSLGIIEALLERGARVQAYDPKATDVARRLLGERVTLCGRSYDAVEGADALVVVTEWNEFREPDFRRVKALMRRPAVFDGRNIYNPLALRELGFFYQGIGRR
jgi:UDPglucose 6-dehydrogenase